MSNAGSTSNDIFTFPLYISLIPVGVALVFLALGILCFRVRKARRLSYFMFAVALMAGGFFAPAMLLDKIAVTSQEIVTTTGFWFSPTREGFVYREVEFVRVTTYRDIKGRVCAAWDIHFLDGRVRQIPLSDLWSLNSKRIVTLLQSYGVLFSQ